DGETVAGERVADAVRQRRLRDDGELRGRRQRRPDERRERDDERRLGRERLDAGRRLAGEEPRSKAGPADESAQDVGGERDALEPSRAEIDAEVASEVTAGWHGNELTRGAAYIGRATARIASRTAVPTTIVSTVI